MPLAPCPCGKTPKDVNINTVYSAKWGQVSGDCCGEWIIEFRTEYKKEGAAELHELAVRAWNEAERNADLRDEGPAIRLDPAQEPEDGEAIAPGHVLELHSEEPDE